MKTTRRLVYSVELSVLILFLLVGISWYNYRKSEEREAWVVHTHEVLTHAQEIRLHTQAAELRARNFMLLGTNSDKSAFLAETRAALSQLEEVRLLTRDNAKQKLLLDSAAADMAKNILFLRALIRTRRDAGVEKAVLLVQSGQGRHYADALGGRLREIARREQQLLLQRQAAVKRQARIMNLSVTITVAFILTLIGVLLLRNRRENREKRRAFASLKANNERMRQAEALASFGSWSVDPVSGAFSGSDELYQMIGLSAESCTTVHDLLTLVHPDDRELVIEKYKRLSASPGTDRYEFRILTPGGEKYIQNGSLVTQDPSGKTASITGYVQDLTAARKTEAELRQAQQELEILFNRIDEVFFSREMRSNRLIQISATCKRLYGYTPEDFTNRQELWLDIIHPDDRHKAANEALGLEKGHTLVNKYRIVRRDGGIRWVENKIIPTLDGSGTLIRIDGVSRDITAKITAARELRESEDRNLKMDANLRTIVDNTSISYVLVDSSLVIVSYNKPAEEYSRRFNHKKLVAGDLMTDYFTDESRANVIDILRRVKNGEHVCYEYRLVQPDGSEQWFEVQWANAKDKSGRHQGYVLANKNITETKRDAIERERIVKELVARNEALEEFSYLVSHDLRLPVANIIGLGEALNLVEPGSAQREELMNDLVHSAQRLDAMVRRLNEVLTV